MWPTGTDAGGGRPGKGGAGERPGRCALIRKVLDLGRLFFLIIFFPYGRSWRETGSDGRGGGRGRALLAKGGCLFVDSVGPVLSCVRSMAD